MRNTLELLILLRSVVEEYMQHTVNKGLCAVILDLHDETIINYQEHYELNQYISENMPQDYEYILGKPFSIGMYGWEPNNIEVRIEWLDEQINKLL